jgi:hypothetical protein
MPDGDHAYASEQRRRHGGLLPRPLGGLNRRSRDAIAASSALTLAPPHHIPAPHQRTTTGDEHLASRERTQRAQRQHDALGLCFEIFALFAANGHVVPDGQALAKARAIAQLICDNGPLAVEAIVRTLHETDGMTETEALAHEYAYGWQVFQSEDAKEGPRAFKEKRKPNFPRR